ncbi:uncharacterized protein PHACADRAFT_105743 [Phanerochaete carnosa HHB-10118-sp]|uniref:Oxo-4-hydroxy-4-carboxy-5-ureidoimidazoline decarboxylase domain-containing protein n=1 Tax=Phanerochaete carnosa (strain HHB-10118-sp) TaxID=650164 RepID=K5VT22_PHACS|nr:uncharacterized protein PHACADRAFT_105743 [Phanerochaete carnosa HHB-10118-sp]EKM49930.1 hypothetical protein PHACADRAFT_105743 [Phanerochaete carnosa HHB-10118-sp]
MSSLPTLSALQSGLTDAADGALAQVLAVLFEPSPTLFAHLVPQLAGSLPSANVHSYADLVDRALDALHGWDERRKARFVDAHPRIGEVRHLSALSAREQAAAATPRKVLARLAHLNACYEHRYPGLRYITFVNGRTREQIMEEMEGVLGIPHSLSASEPEVEGVGQAVVGGPEWKGEVDRAIESVGKIAKARLKALGVE